MNCGFTNFVKIAEENISQFKFHIIARYANGAYCGRCTVMRRSGKTTALSDEPIKKIKTKINTLFVGYVYKNRLDCERLELANNV